MKVEQPSNARKSGVSTHGVVGSLLRILMLAGILIVVGILLFTILRPDAVQTFARDIEIRWGYEFRKADAALTEKISIAIGAWLRDTKDGVADIPELVFDVPFKEMSRIYEKREEAIARGILVQSPDDFVKAKIRYQDRTIPVKLRLKGDWTDHLTGLKWSFRIHTRNGEQLFGMRRFSIQNPATRGFQSELLFFELLSRYSVMRPRYMFVNVTVNGETVGLMALEEFFSKELLEYNRRREGVIVRFDESLVWDAKDSAHGEAVGWGGAFDHYSNAPIDAFGSSRIAESPFLSGQYRLAEGLLRGFVSGELQAADVFDVDQIGAYIAVADFLGSWHTVAWHNQRFYLNPISQRLEPIAFDATLQERFEGDNSVVNDEPLMAALLRDPLIWQRYTTVLRELAGLNADGSMARLMRAAEQEPLGILQTEFRMLGVYPLDNLQARVDGLLEKVARHEEQGGDSRELNQFAEKEVDQYPAFAHFGLFGGMAEPRLRIETAIPKEVLISAIEWVRPADGNRESAMIDSAGLPLSLPARGIGSLGKKFDMAIRPPSEAGGWALEITAGLQGRTWQQQFRAQRIVPALSASPVPVAALEVQLEQHPFLTLDENDGLRVEVGDWQVDESLIIPAGYPLRIDAGTRLRFATNAMLVSHSPVHISGTADAPVRLEPADGESWPGLVVMNAAGESRLEHVIVRDTRSINQNGWVLTGGVNFYASNVQLQSSQLRDSHGEDALNIIHSEFVLVDTLIDGTVSDAFDADFASGTVTGGEFVNIGKAGGGDAIDVSGSQIKVVGTVFRQVSDKALSVGEKSEMTASEVSIDTVGTGAASKDGSLLMLTDSHIRGAAFAGLTAYIKKPEYGPAEIQAEGITMEATETPVLVQTGSRVSIDGVASEERDVDVDALYETVMKPGLRK